ncbi:MAG: YqaA family protein [Alphaproteobacteria bacterium]
MALPRYLRVGAAVEFCMHYAETRKAMWLFGILSVLESAFLPIPIDAATIPMMLVNKARVWAVAAVGTLTSVAGGIVGYLIGWLTYASIGAWLIGVYGFEAGFAEFQADMTEDIWTGALVLLIGAITPVPYKLTCIVAGFVEFDFAMFLVVSLFGRGVRFYGMAVVFYFFGPPLKRLLIRYKTEFTILLLVVVAGGFVALKYLV